ncbi:MAG: type II toxin-antitoxin system RelE/ParE family toxin [Proteobacteria bacterium]|nr:type II toxin-antitoxin system RelE/ParE family toxin [Pseudomonadota bacterium]
MPLVDRLGGDIWEVRIKLHNRIARVALDGQTMVLLLGFIKKQQAAPKTEPIWPGTRGAKNSGDLELNPSPHRSGMATESCPDH